MHSLLQPPTAGPPATRPSQRLPLLTPDRRPWALGIDGSILLGDAPVTPAHLGSWLDALLNLARPTLWRRVPAEVARGLADTLAGWLWTPGPDADQPLERLRWEGATDAALAVLWRMRQESADPALLDGITPRLRGLALSSLGHALLETLDGAPSTDHRQALLEQTDWLLSPRVSFFSGQEEYELAWPDVALMWCGLSRSVDSDAFEWFKSGHIIFHMHAPDGPRISREARGVWTALLARHPGPSAFRGWHDEVAACIPELRRLSATSIEGRVHQDPPQAGSTPGIHLSTAQRDRLGPWRDAQGFSQALEEAAGWLPQARDIGALAPSAEQGLVRACLGPADLPTGMAREADHGRTLSELAGHLAQGRWMDVPITDDGLLPILHELHRKHLAHADDALWVRSVLRAHPHGELVTALPRFADGFEGAVRWSALPAWMEGWRWRLQGQPTLRADPLDFQEWCVAHGLAHSQAEHMQAVELLLLLEASLPDLAAAGVDHVVATHAPDLVHALTWRRGDGWWLLDSAGRLQRLQAPASTWFEATLGGNQVTLRAGVRPPGRLPHLLHPGDLHFVPHVGWRLLSEVPHAGPWTSAHRRSGHLVHHGAPELPAVTSSVELPRTPAAQVHAQHQALAEGADPVRARILGAALLGEGPQGRWVLSDGSHLAPAPDGRLDLVHLGQVAPHSRRHQRAQALRSALRHHDVAPA